MSDGARRGAAAADAPTLWQSLRILFGASRGYWLVNSVNFGDGIAYFGMLALMTLFLERNVGFSTGMSTISVSLFTGGVTIFMALGGGWVSDRLGVRRALTLCLGMLLLGRVLLALSPAAGPWSAVHAAAWVSLLVMAAGEGVIQPALYSGIKEYTDRRTETLGYAFLYSIMNLGIVAGEIVSPLVREQWARRVEGREVTADPTAGIAGAFWFFIAITAGMLAVHLLLFTRRVELRDRTVAAEARAADGGPAAAAVEATGTDGAAAARAPDAPAGAMARETAGPADAGAEPNEGWLAGLRRLPILDTRFQFFIFILLPVRTLFAHQWLTMPHFVTRAFPAEVGARWEWINGLNPLVIVVFVPLIAALTRHRRVVDMMIAGTAVSALSTFMLAGEPNVTMLLAYVVVFSLGEAAWSSRFLEYVADIAPVNRVGIYMGIATIPWFLAKTVTGFYSGAMLDRFVPVDGPQSAGTLWLIYAVVALISPLGLLLARGWLVRGVRNEGVGAAAGPA